MIRPEAAELMAKPLRFQNIHKSYGETVALRGVSFDLEPGEVFGLLGPNGAGKTTLIRILMDIVRADTGQLMVFGEPHTRDHLDRIGYLPEERGLYTKQRVLDVLIYFGTLKGLARHHARQRAHDWLERIGLSETSSWRIERLSKGMSQKVQIAAALLNDPDLAVLDEPFTGLDPINVRLVSELIEERRCAGRTTILSTHRMNMVEALCDRVALIHRGRLVEYGSVAEVRERHSLPEVRVEAEGDLARVEGVARAIAEGHGRQRLLLEEGVEPSTVLERLIAAGTKVTGFERALTPLEQIFVRVVEEAEA